MASSVFGLLGASGSSFTMIRCWEFEPPTSPWPVDDPNVPKSTREMLQAVSGRPFYGWAFDDNKMPTSLKVPLVRYYYSNEAYSWTKPDSYTRIFMRNTGLCVDAVEALSALDGLNADPLFLWVVRWVRTVSLDRDDAVSPVYLLLEHILGVILLRHLYLEHETTPWVGTWQESSKYPVPLCSFALPEDGDPRLAYQYDQLPPQGAVSDVLPGLIPLLLPRVRQWNERSRSLAAIQPHTPDTTNTSSTFSNVLLCLDIAESVSKLIPGFGYIAEGACGVIRKIITAVETARIARADVISLAARTAGLTIAILNEIASCPRGMHIDTNLMDFWVTLREVEHATATLCKYSSLKYFVFRSRIKDTIQDLTAKLETARTVFSVTRQISTTHLLMQLQGLQTRLMIRIEEIQKAQVDHQQVLNQKLDLIILMQKQGA